MKRFLSCVIAVLATSLLSVGQDPYEEVEESLRDKFNLLTTLKDDHRRIAVNDSIRMIIEGYVQSDSIFNHRLIGIRYLGQITSPDSLLKIITWNLLLDGKKGKYFCYLVRRGEGSSNIVFPLEASYTETGFGHDTTFSRSSWYGALYYDLRPVSVNGERCWMVLGLDYGNPEITRKVIDVICFSKKGELVFGKKWFETPDGMMHRVVFEYAASAMMTLRFSSDTSVVFDHLVPISPELAGKKQFYGPDYSFDAYLYDKGLWKFTLNVEMRNEE